MILEGNMTMAAYRCPACGATVKSMVGAFSLSADMMKLKCPCGGSEMMIEYRRDGKIRLTVPCFLCPRPHIYTVSKNIFFGRDIFMFPCSYTGVDIGFVGSEENVESAIRESDIALEDILGDASFEEMSQGSSGGVFDDPQILDIVLFVIDELAAEGHIHCGCGDGLGEYETSVLDDSVRVSCKRCRRHVDIPAGSTIAANAFLHCDEITLT